MFPQRLDSPLAYDIAKAMLDGFNRHYRLFRTESARAKHRFETADWHGQQRAQRERIEFYDLRVKEAVRAAGEGVQGRRAADGGVAAGQAALHRPADRPPPAGAGRDLLQLGHHQDPAPHATSTTTSSSCGRRSAPSTSRTTSRRPRPPTAPTTRRARRCARPSCASSTTSGCSGRSRTCERDAGHGAGGDAARGCARSSCAPTSRSRCCRRLFFRNKGAYVVGKIINGFNEVPFALPILHDKQGKLVHRRLPVRRGRPADAVLLRARLLHGRHGDARRPTCSSCAR